MKLSVVSTLYHSEAHVRDFVRRTGLAAAEVAADGYEIILVNDGSPDDSLQRAVEMSAEGAHVKVVDLSRNFGHHKAMMAGLAHAAGDLVFLIDSDLEEEPEWLPAFHRQLAAERCDVVYGVQQRRKGGWFERVSGGLFYRLMRSISGVDMPPNMVTARLMTRRYVAALLRHQEREIDIGGLWAITGFEQRGLVVTKHQTSETTYTLRRKLALLVNSVTSFSNAPLVAIFYVGMAVLALAIAYLAVVIGRWACCAQPVSGWTSIIVSVWLLGGLIISFLGIIGVYLAKVFSEVKQRPYTIVRDLHGFRDTV